MDYKRLGLPVLHYLLELAQTHVHWVDDVTQPFYLLPLPSPPALNLSQHQGLFQWVGSSHQVAKLLELQLQYQSFQWIFRVDFFRIDWFYLLVVQGILKSLLQHRSSKASILQHLGFFMVQLSHPYMITGKTIALTLWAFVIKAMSLLFIMLSRFVMAFLPRSRCLLISWLVQILKDDAVKVLHSTCQQIWKTQQWPQDWKMSVFIPIPKNGNAKECLSYHTIASFHMLAK